MAYAISHDVLLLWPANRHRQQALYDSLARHFLAWFLLSPMYLTKSTSVQPFAYKKMRSTRNGASAVFDARELKKFKFWIEHNTDCGASAWRSECGRPVPIVNTLPLTAACTRHTLDHSSNPCIHGA